MATTLSRRALLRGHIAGIAPAVRPPWALQEHDFIAQCTRCDECVGACHEGIIQKGDGGFPEINFSRGECTFCGDCVNACDSGALSQTAQDAGHSPWQLQLSIRDNCLALNRVVCRSCAEQCEQRAIQFRPAPGGVSRPEVHTDQCNGCGACVGPCPVAAITLTTLQLSGTAGTSQQEINP